MDFIILQLKSFFIRRSLFTDATSQLQLALWLHNANRLVPPPDFLLLLLTLHHIATSLKKGSSNLHSYWYSLHPFQMVLRPQIGEFFLTDSLFVVWLAAFPWLIQLSRSHFQLLFFSDKIPFSWVFQFILEWNGGEGQGQKKIKQSGGSWEFFSRL